MIPSSEVELNAFPNGSYQPIPGCSDLYVINS